MSNPIDERLRELRKSISEMSDDELHEIIGTSRNNRRPAPKKVKAKAAPKKKQPKLPDFSNLTPEQAQALIDKLTNG